MPTRRAFTASLIAAPFLKAAPIRTVPTIPNTYSGWSTLARRRNGDLVLAWSGDREAHVCPFGRVHYAVSRDEGETWTWPRVLMDLDIDDRDAGVVETSRGTLLVTTFTSLAYESHLAKAPQHWTTVHNRADAATRKALLGNWMLRSTDGGVTWSVPYRVPVNSPHGPTTTSTGRLLYAGKDLYGPDTDVGVCESTDDGQTWRWLARVPVREGDQPKNYHELHMVEAAADRLVLHIRNHNTANRNETLQSESTDGGKTWSTPHEIGVWGLPSHLLRLRDGRLVMSYGHRRAPFGNQARVSADAGRTWGEPITISDDGASGDLGYPSTVELTNGDLLTIWYELRPDSKQAILRQRRWTLHH